MRKKKLIKSINITLFLLNIVKVVNLLLFAAEGFRLFDTTVSTIQIAPTCLEGLCILKHPNSKNIY
jgi:hypothetical protein